MEPEVTQSEFTPFVDEAKAILEDAQFLLRHVREEAGGYRELKRDQARKASEVVKMEKVSQLKETLLKLLP